MIKSLTSLRGIFIIFIFLHHCRQFYIGGGTMAVAFFFVLGGFSMTLGYKDRVLQPGFNYGQYLVRRCIKFYPLHWVCLLAALGLEILSFKLWKVPVFFINAALLQTIIPIKGIYFSFNSVSWYLADTMFFSVFFPFLFKWILKATPKGKIGIAMLFVMIYIVVAFLLPTDWYHAILYVSPFMRIQDFVFGIFLGLAFQRVRDQSKEFRCHNAWSQIVVFSIVILLVIESCVLPTTAQLIAPVYWPLIAVLLMIASLSSISERGGGKILEHPILLRLGELSFTIFLTHQLVIRYSKLVVDKIHFFDKNIIFILFSFLLTLGVSVLLEKYVLNPITQWLTKRNQQSMIAHS